MLHRLIHKYLQNIDKKQRPSFKLYDETKGNKSVYERNAIKSDYCDSILNQTFFSKKNIDIIQNNIRHNLCKQTGQQRVIGRQSDTEYSRIRMANST